MQKFSLIKEKSFYKMLASIATPIVLQNLVSFAVQIADSLMVGALNETAFSAVNLANQMSFIFMIFCFGFASGGSMLIAQYWGKKDIKTISKIVSFTVSLMVIISFIFAAIGVLFPEFVMRLYTPDQALITEGAKYLRVMTISFLFYGISNTYLMILRSVEQVKFPLFVGFISFLLNVFFNYAFIFGEFGFPELGVVGAAIGTLIARATELLLAIIYNVKFGKNAKITIKNMLKPERWLVKDYFKHALPVVFNEMLWGIGSSIHAAIFGRMGQAAVAATSVVGTVMQIGQMAIFGLGNATAIIVGKAIGAGDVKRARDTAYTLNVLSVFVGIFAAVVIFLSGGIFIDLYELPESTKVIANEVLIVGGIMAFVLSIEFVNLIGVLRAGGDVTFVLKLDLLSMWLFAVPAGALAGLYFNAPVWLVYFFVRSDAIIKGAGAFVRMLQGKWVRNITRDFD